MRILVLIKYSLDVAEIKVDPSTLELRLSGAPCKVGNIDKVAVEAAVQLKEKAGGTVQALSFGPAAARESFRDILAMGVDDVTLVQDPFDGQVDSAARVSVLEAAIRKLGPFDLIVCGFASDDGYSHQTGPRLAERLDLPLVSYVRRMNVLDGRLEADRDLDDCLQSVSVGLPALVSVAEEAFPARRTTLMDALKAKKKPVNVWQVGEDLGLEPSALQAQSQIASASQVGILVHRKQVVLKGAEMSELADQLIDALLAEGVLRGEA